jgi:hypothetical protein
VNVGSERFHEGRGAGKSTTPGGHIIVSRKRIVTAKEKLHEKKSYVEKIVTRRRGLQRVISGNHA